VRKVLRQVAVIGQQNQALCINIQTAHVEKSLRPIKNEVANTGPTAFVTHRRHHADGLIDCQHQCLFSSGDSGAIDVDSVAVGINPHALLAHWLAIDTHATLFNELLAGASTTYTSLREHLLQADPGLCLSCHD
jgi:hypothetical protein